MTIFKTIAVAALLATSALAQFSTPMRDVENPARTAVAFAYSCTTPVGPALACTTSYSIPPGHRLVIRQVSVRAANGLVPGANNATLILVGGLSGASTEHYASTISYSSLAHYGSRECFIVVDSLVDPVNPTVPTRVLGAATSANVYVSGYLLKM